MQVNSNVVIIDKHAFTEKVLALVIPYVKQLFASNADAEAAKQEAEAFIDLADDSTMIADMIPYGEENAISGTDLARNNELTLRQLGERIAFLCCFDVPVCSSDAGYFYPVSQSEAEQYCVGSYGQFSPNSNSLIPFEGPPYGKYLSEAPPGWLSYTAHRERRLERPPRRAEPRKACRQLVEADISYKEERSNE